MESIISQEILRLITNSTNHSENSHFVMCLNAICRVENLIEFRNADFSVSPASGMTGASSKNKIGFLKGWHFEKLCQAPNIGTLSS